MKKRFQKKLTGGEGIVECLRIEGVESVFNVPGESFLPVLDALEHQDSIHLISNRHEGGAGFMAEGYAKASGKPGVLMATRGVGAANASIAIHTAFQDSTPLVVFLGQVKREFRGREGFQEVDFGNNFAEVAKWTTEINDVTRVPELVQKAFRVAQTGRPGPVLVSLPEDMLFDEALMTFGPPAHKSRPVPSSEEIDQFRKLLQHAERPMVIAGGGVTLSGAEKAISHFVEKFGIPVMAGFRRQDIIDNHHPAYVGHMGLGTHRSLVKLFQDADLVIALGTRLSEATSQDYTLLSPEQTLIHVDIDAGTLGKVYAPDLGIVADLNMALEAFTKLQFEYTWKEWLQTCKQSFDRLVESSGDASIYSRVVQTLYEKLPDHTLLTNDAGNYATWVNACFRLKDANTFIAPTNGAMGYGLPAAIGAKKAAPHRPVVALCGDGGLMMTVQEIETSIRENIPVICVVFNNEMYGTIRMHQEMHYPKKVIGTDLGKTNFVEMAKAMGANGFCVQDGEGFQEALESALEEEQTTVIEVKCEEEPYVVYNRTIEDMRQTFQS
ncbi:acetolactate synthase-1/2/3 large subunit [Geomicrobium halophilum]|uniref:Acetolactate synthase-1/2/3 large subunit n=1 Tax=Geomicrobium halophilum TaxID=549000 RepID=A0A841PN62_9BACL|nr:thiamine pyrophosphate-dependent enzyme [Geomicrobium halophilum]MBB6450189.1 acetolactate synthase-1/2/3 large subunit [Geomicrobium halophilum]